jgi:hypothetical protein
MAPTLEDLLALPPDQITPQHVHALGLAPDPIVPPPTPAPPPIAKMTPPAAAAPEPALPKMTPPADTPGLTFHYHEAPETKPKEPKTEKAEENPTGFRAGTAEGAERPPEPTTKSELPTKLTPPVVPSTPAAAPLSLQPGPAPAPAVAPMRPPVIPQPTTASALPSTVMPSAPAPTGIDTSLLDAPKRSLEGFQSREAEPRNLSLNTTAGGPAILDRPGTSGEQADIIARSRDEAAHPWGTPENHPGALGKLAHVAARIGNIAGNIVAPATMANIPGTDLYKRREENLARERQAGAETRETAREAVEQRPEIAEAQGELRAQLQAEKDRAAMEREKSKEGSAETVTGMKTSSAEKREESKEGSNEKIAGGKTASAEKIASEKNKTNEEMLRERMAAAERIATGHNLATTEAARIRAAAANDPNKLTNTMKTMKQQAQSTLPGIDRALDETERIANKLGPSAGRWNDFWQGKVGEKDEEFSHYKDEIAFISTAVTLAHARGRMSNELFEHFQKMFDAGKQAPENMIQALNVAKEWLGEYAAMGEPGSPVSGGGAAPTPKPTGGGGLANPEENATRTNKKTGEVQTFIEGKWQTTKPAARQ